MKKNQLATWNINDDKDNLKNTSSIFSEDIMSHSALFAAGCQ